MEENWKEREQLGFLKEMCDAKHITDTRAIQFVVHSFFYFSRVGGIIFLSVG